MPRRDSSGRSSRPAPRPAAARSPPPQPAHRAPPPALAQSGGGGMLSGIGSTIAQGMAFGTGSAVEHSAVDAVMGPRTIQHETVATEDAATAPTPTANSLGSDACGVHTKAFQNVLNHRGIRSVTFSSENATRDAVEGTRTNLDGCGPNGGSGHHGGGSGVSISRSDVRLFRLGGLIVGVSLVSGGLGLGLGFGGRIFALGVSIREGGLDVSVRRGKTKRE